MSKDLLIAIAITLTAVLTILVSSFNYSLPTWCANPSGIGNSIVHPLCK